MAKQNIGTGETFAVRDPKLNANFTELYDKIENPSGAVEDGNSDAVSGGTAFSAINHNSNGVDAYGISFDFNTVSEEVTIVIDNGQLFSKSNLLGALANGTTVFAMESDYVLIYLDKNRVIQHKAFSSYDDVSDIEDIIICRYWRKNYGALDVVINYCLAKEYTLDGIIYTNYSNYDYLNTRGVYNSFKESGENNYSVSVDSMGSSININGNIQYFFKDKTIGINGFVGFYATSSIAFTEEFSYLLFDISTQAYSFIKFTSVSQDDLYNKVIIGLFRISDTNVWANLTSGIGWTYNGTYLKNGESLDISPLTFSEIGDSISSQRDGKKEYLRTQYPTGEGYVDTNGYGQLFTKYFGITYDNHKSHGLNGRTFCEYMKDVLTPPDGDLVYLLPKDSDIYSVFLGTNDWGKDVALGTTTDYLNDTFDDTQYPLTETTYGGLRKLVDYIKDDTDTRDKQIFFITPIGYGTFGYDGSVVFDSTWQTEANGEITERINSQGVKMSDIVTAIKYAADQIGAYVIDLYGEGGMVQKSRLNIDAVLDGSGNPFVYQGVLKDNLHPSEIGHKRLGNYINKEIDKIIQKQ